MTTWKKEAILLVLLRCRKNRRPVRTGHREREEGSIRISSMIGLESAFPRVVVSAAFARTAVSSNCGSTAPQQDTNQVFRTLHDVGLPSKMAGIPSSSLTTTVQVRCGGIGWTAAAALLAEFGLALKRCTSSISSWIYSPKCSTRAL